MKRILVCTDGEEHTVKAERYAVTLAEGFGAVLTGLYVQSTFLTKFTHEIYAVNRNECRRHIDDSLRSEGVAALAGLGDRCLENGVRYESKIRVGDVAEEILLEASDGSYDLLIMGAKLLSGWRDRLESFNVPQIVFRRAGLPMLFVR